MAGVQRRFTLLTRPCTFLSHRSYFKARPGPRLVQSKRQAVQLRDGRGHAEAEPIPGDVPRRCRAIEALKNLVTVGRQDTGAAVADLDTWAIGRLARRNLHAAVLRRKFYRVVDEVCHRFAQQVRVAAKKNGGFASSVIEIDFASAKGS